MDGFKIRNALLQNSITPTRTIKSLIRITIRIMITIRRRANRVLVAGKDDIRYNLRTEVTKTSISKRVGKMRHN